MKASERKRYESETAGYCKNITNNQLQNVYEAETERGKRQGEVGAVARIFAANARTELERRGLV